jgi:hypothetical protein
MPRPEITTTAPPGRPPAVATNCTARTTRTSALRLDRALKCDRLQWCARRRAPRDSLHISTRLRDCAKSSMTPSAEIDSWWWKTMCSSSNCRCAVRVSHGCHSCHRLKLRRHCRYAKMTSSFEQRLCCMLATTADCWKGSKETRTLRLIGPCSAATSLYQSP